MPVQLISEKYLQAERRNRLEKTRLDVACKHYDRETTKLNFEIDREKRFIRKGFRNVVKTSGQSDAGIPPKDQKDTDFEKCPSYRQGLRLSNKRLLEWRECEKQLNKFIQNHNSEMTKNRKRKTISAKSDKSERSYKSELVNGVNGIDIDDNDDVFIDDDVVSTTTSVDPMDALKENQEKKEFNVKDWEKEIIESYKMMVSKTVPKSNPKDNNTYNGRLKSNSSPAIITTDVDSNKVKVRMRPHTAQTHRRPPSAGRWLPPRPASAQVVRNNTSNTKQFIITKDSIFIKTGHKYEKLLDNKSVEKPVMINNYLDTISPAKSLGKKDTLSPSKPSLRSSSMTSMNSLCPVQERNEDETLDENDGDEQTPGDTDLNTADNTVNESPVNIDYNGTSESEHQQQNESQRRPSNHALLKQAVQKWKRRKSERLISEASSMSDTKSRASLLHSNSDLSSYVESMRRLRKDSSFKHSNSDLSTYVESSRRTRRDSESASSRISLSSYLPSGSLGIPADIEDISHVQEKLASEVSAERPVAANKLVNVTTVVKAAMTFSRVARKRILAKMVDENSTDPHELIRQERLRKNQSRQSVLNSIANQWNDDAQTLIEAVE